MIVSKSILGSLVRETAIDASHAQLAPTVLPNNFDRSANIKKRELLLQDVVKYSRKDPLRELRPGESVINQIASYGIFLPLPSNELAPSFPLDKNRPLRLQNSHSMTSSYDPSTHLAQSTASLSHSATTPLPPGGSLSTSSSNVNVSNTNPNANNHPPHIGTLPASLSFSSSSVLSSSSGTDLSSSGFSRITPGANPRPVPSQPLLAKSREEHTKAPPRSPSSGHSKSPRVLPHSQTSAPTSSSADHPPSQSTSSHHLPSQSTSSTSTAPEKPSLRPRPPVPNRPKNP